MLSSPCPESPSLSFLRIPDGKKQLPSLSKLDWKQTKRTHCQAIGQPACRAGREAGMWTEQWAGANRANSQSKSHPSNSLWPLGGRSCRALRLHRRQDDMVLAAVKYSSHAMPWPSPPKGHPVGQDWLHTHTPSLPKCLSWWERDYLLLFRFIHRRQGLFFFFFNYFYGKFLLIHLNKTIDFGRNETRIKNTCNFLLLDWKN